MREKPNNGLMAMANHPGWRKKAKSRPRQLPNHTADEAGSPNNDQRALWAEVALDAFIGETGQDIDETAVCDLLCNLAHWCDRNKARFQNALRIAGYHYQAETQGKGTQLK